MRSFSQLLTGLGCLVFGAFLTAATAVAQQDSKIIKLVGSAANATITRGNQTLPASEGMPVQIGDVINAGAGVDVFYQAYSGAVATLKANGHVKVEAIQGDTALLDLTAGGGGKLVTQIEPHQGHKFGVRTPKGVAAAKGTVYVTEVAGQTYTVVTSLSGNVSVYVGDVTQNNTSSALQSIADAGTAGNVGANTVTITPGGSSVLNPSGTFGTLEGTDPRAATAVTSAAQIAVTAMAQLAASGNTTAAGELQTVMNTVVKTVSTDSLATIVASASAAAPSEAKTIVETTINAAANTGKNVIDTAKTATQAAAQGAVSKAADSTEAQNLTKDIATAGANAAVKNSGTNADAGAIAKDVASSTVTGANAGAAQNTSAGGLAALGTSIISGAQQGATDGATSAAPGQATNIQNGAQQGANSGTKPGAGTETVLPNTTPSNPVNPDLSISPSG